MTFWSIVLTWPRMSLTSTPFWIHYQLNNSFSGVLSASLPKLSLTIWAMLFPLMALLLTQKRSLRCWPSLYPHLRQLFVDSWVSPVSTGNSLRTTQQSPLPSRHYCGRSNSHGPRKPCKLFKHFSKLWYKPPSSPTRIFLDHSPLKRTPPLQPWVRFYSKTITLLLITTRYYVHDYSEPRRISASSTPSPPPLGNGVTICWERPSRSSQTIEV